MSHLDRVRTELNRRDLDGLLIGEPNNRRYTSGFTGTTADVLVGRKGAHLVTDARYVEQAAAQAPAFRVHLAGNAPGERRLEVLRRLAREEGIRRLGFESDFVTVDGFAALQQAFDDVELIAAGGLVEQLRQVKDAEEVAAIRRAAGIADAAFKHLLGFIRPGLKEQEVALELELFMRRQGASGLAFETIVASGPRSSMPHGVASDRVLAPGDLVTLDYGCVLDGYCSDMTRTVVLGEPEDWQRELYEIVLVAEERGVAAARPGIAGKELDGVVRGYITDKGYGPHFGHSTGHGVGLYIHEGPRINSLGEGRLVPGNVVTVEPGIYLPGRGGVRIEDLVLITADGAETLSHSPKDLIILD